MEGAESKLDKKAKNENLPVAMVESEEDSEEEAKEEEKKEAEVNTGPAKKKKK